MRRVLFAVLAGWLLVPVAGSAQEATPAPVSATAAVGDQWEVSLVRVYDDVRELDPEATWFNGWVDQNPAPEGSRYFAVQVRIKNIGAEAGNPIADLSFALVTPTGFTYDGIAHCGTVPGGLSFGDQLDAGDAIDANLCWVIEDRHEKGLVLHVYPSFSTDDTEAIVFGLYDELATPVP